MGGSIIRIANRTKQREFPHKMIKNIKMYRYTLTMILIVQQGPTVLTVGAGAVVWTFLT